MPVYCSARRPSRSVPLARHSRLALALALIARAGTGAADAARVSGVAQGVGYSIATLGPLGAGAWYGLGGSWWPVLAVLIVGALVQAGIGLALARVSRRGGADAAASAPPVASPTVAS